MNWLSSLWQTFTGTRVAPVPSAARAASAAVEAAAIKEPPPSLGQDLLQLHNIVAKPLIANNAAGFHLPTDLEFPALTSSAPLKTETTWDFSIRSFLSVLGLKLST